jgi:hypothetical protein
MPVAENIRKLGFRRWHERQLIEAHASLVTAFMCLIVVVICMDQLNWREAGYKPFLDLLLIVGGLALCFHTVRFYFKVMLRAEHFAEQAVCSACQTYGVIQVLATSAPHARQDSVDPDASEWFKVRCRKCGHDWTMTASQVGASDTKRQ